MSAIAYEYMVHTWGGFYNDEHKRVHGLEPGYYWFPTAEARAEFMRARTVIEVELDARVLASVEYEGTNTRFRTIARMDLVLDGNTYHVSYDFGFAYPADAAEFMFMEGNYSCDCNLRSMICEIYPEVPLDRRCGDDIEILNFRVEAVQGYTENYAPLDIGAKLPQTAV